MIIPNQHYKWKNHNVYDNSWTVSSFELVDGVGPDHRVIPVTVWGRIIE